MNRFQHPGTVGLAVTIGLLLVLAVQTGLAAATTSTSRASPRTALQGDVTIHLVGPGLGPRNPAGHGRFTMFGAI